MRWRKYAIDQRLDLGIRVTQPKSAFWSQIIEEPHQSWEMKLIYFLLWVKVQRKGGLLQKFALSSGIGFHFSALHESASFLGWFSSGNKIAAAELGLNIHLPNCPEDPASPAKVEIPSVGLAWVTIMVQSLRPGAWSTLSNYSWSQGWC
jgi:hypothetical protein